METPPETQSDSVWETDYHWKVVAGPNHELRIEPMPMGCLAVAMAVWAVIFSGGVLLLGIWDSDWEPGIYVFMSLLSVAVGLTLAAGIWYASKAELQRGEYIILNNEGVHLRNGRRVDLNAIDSFELFRRWEDRVEIESYSKVTHLILVCKSQERLDIAQSPFHREVVKLKKKLEDHVAFWTDQIHSKSNL